MHRALVFPLALILALTVGGIDAGEAADLPGDATTPPVELALIPSSANLRCGLSFAEDGGIAGGSRHLHFHCTLDPEIEIDGEHFRILSVGQPTITAFGDGRQQFAFPERTNARFNPMRHIGFHRMRGAADRPRTVIIQLEAPAGAEPDTVDVAGTLPLVLMSPEPVVIEFTAGAEPQIGEVPEGSEDLVAGIGVPTLGDAKATVTLDEAVRPRLLDLAFVDAEGETVRNGRRTAGVEDGTYTMNCETRGDFAKLRLRFAADVREVEGTFALEGLRMPWPEAIPDDEGERGVGDGF